MKNARRIVALIVALMMLGLTACGSSSAPAADKSIIIGQASEVANLNPMEYPRTPDSNVQALIFSYLVQPDENLVMVPDLAESWTVSEDGTVYTFKLRQDVTWHDGEKFDADDVVFTLTSLASPNYVGGNDGRVMDIVGARDVQNGNATEIAGLKKLDQYTVEITLNEANAAFLANMYTSILPEHVLGSEDPGEWENDTFNRAPIGTGKYKFVEWKSGQYITLERYDGYYGTKPAIKNLTIQFGDDTTLVAAMMNGEIDVMYGLPVVEVENVKAANTMSIYEYEQLSVYYIGFNMINDVTSDINVRRALAYGLNMQEVVDTVFNGYATVATDAYPPSHWSHSTTNKQYNYDPDMAKKCLEDSGYVMNAATGYYEKDGKTLHITYDLSTSATLNQMAPIMQQQWKAVGIEVEIITQDFSTLAFTKLLPDSGNAETTGDSYMMYSLGFGVEVDPNEYNEYWSTNTGAGSWNFGHYSNAQVDSLFQQQLRETNQEKRAEIFHQISDIESEDLYWIPTYCATALAGVGNRVENFVCDFRGITYQIEKWDVK